MCLGTIPSEHSLRSSRAKSAGGGGYGSLWITQSRVDKHVLVRVDPLTGQVVATISLPIEGGRILIGGGAVWVAACTCETQPPTLFQIDPQSDRLVRTVRAPGTYERHGSFQQIVSNGSTLWGVSAPSEDTGTTGDSWLWRVDASTGVVRGPDRVGPGVEGIALKSGGVWLIRPVGSTSRSVLVLVDPANGRMVGPATAVGSLAGGITPGGDSLWVSSQEGTGAVLFRVRP